MESDSVADKKWYPIQTRFRDGEMSRQMVVNIYRLDGI